MIGVLNSSHTLMELDALSSAEYLSVCAAEVFGYWRNRVGGGGGLLAEDVLPPIRSTLCHVKLLLFWNVRATHARTDSSCMHARTHNKLPFPPPPAA